MQRVFVESWYPSIYEIAEAAEKRCLVVYGAGFWGQKTFEIFQLFGISPVCFCDDDVTKVGTDYCGIPVISFQDALFSYPDAIYIAAANNSLIGGNTKSIINKKLKAAGVRSEYSWFHPSRYVFLLKSGLDVFDTGAATEEPNLFTAKHIKKMVVLNHMMNSGCWYFTQLIDGHSHLLSIPAFGNISTCAIA